MTLTLEIATSGPVHELLRRLAEHGCLTHVVDDRVCRIVYPRALDGAEEWYEIRFFVRAWLARHGVTATLSPEYARS